jgi:hypothetical protein
MELFVWLKEKKEAVMIKRLSFFMRVCLFDHSTLIILICGQWSKIFSIKIMQIKVLSGYGHLKN